MKFKPIYLYMLIFLIALVSVIIISNSESTDDAEIVTNVDSMPNDDIHKSLEGQTMSSPSGSNVASSIINKMTELENYVQKNPRDTAKVKEYADLLAGAHNQDKAIELYKSILAIDGKRLDVLSSISFVYFNKNNFTKAKEYIENIIKIDPNNTEAIYNLGVLDTRIGDIEGARKQWEDLVTNHPNTKMSKMAKESLQKLSSSN